MRIAALLLCLCSCVHAGPIESVKAGMPLVHFPLGVYTLTEPLKIPSNVIIVCEPGTIIEAAKGAFLGEHDVLIFMDLTTKSEIHGCTFRMNKADYGTYGTPKPPYVPSEHRHAISMLGAKRIKLDNVRCELSGGDGIYIGAHGPSSARMLSEDINITNCVMDQNLRQGMSVIGVKNLVVEDCTFSGTKGASPQAGLDCENEYRTWITATFRRCHSTGNRGAAYVVSLGKANPDDQPCRIAFEDCTYASLPIDSISLHLVNVFEVDYPTSTFMGKDLPIGTSISWDSLTWRKDSDR